MCMLFVLKRYRLVYLQMMRFEFRMKFFGGLIKLWLSVVEKLSSQRRKGLNQILSFLYLKKRLRRLMFKKMFFGGNVMFLFFDQFIFKMNVIVLIVFLIMIFVSLRSFNVVMYIMIYFVLVMMEFLLLLMVFVQVVCMFVWLIGLRLMLFGVMFFCLL